jgi:7-cyano-7-deazaguanine synthase in queuosine biosynthesis
MKAGVLQNEVTQLLWTGGWDSTFRLLQLLLVRQRAVQPYYLIDAERASTGAELKAMKTIKTRLFQEHPQAQGLLQPVAYVEISDMEPDRETAAAFRAVAARGGIGNQYEWMARFCKQHGIHGIELCIHRDDVAHKALAPFVLEHPVGEYTTCSLDMTRAPLEERVLFCYFQFPLFHLSKVEMAAAAREQNWSPIMNLTWFCHRPTRRQQPCGTCHPCRWTMAEGLGWRIPLSRRIVAGVQRVVFRPLKRATKAVARSLTGPFHHAGTP